MATAKATARKRNVRSAEERSGEYMIHDLSLTRASVPEETLPPFYATQGKPRTPRQITFQQPCGKSGSNTTPEPIARDDSGVRPRGKM